MNADDPTQRSNIWIPWHVRSKRRRILLERASQGGKSKAAENSGIVPGRSKSKCVDQNVPDDSKR